MSACNTFYTNKSFDPNNDKYINNDFFSSIRFFPNRCTVDEINRMKPVCASNPLPIIEKFKEIPKSPIDVNINTNISHQVFYIVIIFMSILIIFLIAWIIIMKMQYLLYLPEKIII